MAARHLRHGHERPDRGAAARLRRDSEVQAEHVGLQARRGGDPRARGADRVVPAARRHAAEDPEHRPSSTRVILEVLQTGTSPRSSAAIADSGQAERRRAAPRPARSFSEPRAGASRRCATGSSTARALEDYRGDLQMHSTWSDGSQTLDDIVEAGIARGYAFCAVTDHSYGLKIAGGVSMADLAEQHREIDRPERQVPRTIPAAQRDRGEHPRGRLGRHGAGRTAAARARRRRAAFGAAIDRADQTARMVTAVRSPRRAHPRSPARTEVRLAPRRHGRLGSGVRGGRRANVAIEIDGDPSRQDVDYDLARAAVARRLPLRARQRRALHARSSRTRKPRSRTPGSPASRRSHRQLLADRQAARMAARSG